jgi:small-conductance mechanosensitive channel
MTVHPLAWGKRKRESLEMIKAKIVRLVAIALAAAAFLLMLGGGALAVARRGLLPQFPWLDAKAWLPADDELVTLVLARVDIGLVAALVGAVLFAIGVLTAMRRSAWLRAEIRRREDGRRRVQQYRADEGRSPYDSRLEPFIGTPAVRGGREADRRVA